MTNEFNQDLYSSVANIGKNNIKKALKWSIDHKNYPYPVSVQLNLTTRCTAKCAHCHQWNWPNQEEFSKKELKDLFSLFKSWNLNTVTLSGGNPLLHPNIIDVLKLANEKKIKVGIITEGYELDREFSNEICKYAKWIRFSIDGPNSNVHDRIRNTPGLFSKVIKNISQLKSIKSNLKIGLNYVIQKSNVYFIHDMIDLSKKEEIDFLLFKISHGTDPEKNYTLSERNISYLKSFIKIILANNNHQNTNIVKLNFLLERMFSEVDIINGYPTNGHYLKNQIKCFAPLFSIVCDCRGNVYPCCYLYSDNRPWKKYGNIRSEFIVGNLLRDGNSVFNNLSRIMQKKIFHLPSTGFRECGSCTRFCQLNTILTQLYSSSHSMNIDTLLSNYFNGQNQNLNEEGIFL